MLATLRKLPSKLRNSYSPEKARAKLESITITPATTTNMHPTAQTATLIKEAPTTHRLTTDVQTQIGEAPNVIANGDRAPTKDSGVAPSKATSPLVTSQSDHPPDEPLGIEIATESHHLVLERSGERQKADSPLASEGRLEATLHAITSSSKPMELPAKSHQVRFARINAECYVATHVEITPMLKSEFQTRIHPLLREFLCHLRLDDPRISLDCALVSRKEQETTLVPTVLFICLTNHQKKLIETGLNGRNFFPSPFEYRVVVQELRLASGIYGSASNPGSLTGLSILAALERSPKTICGIKAYAQESEIDDVPGGKTYPCFTIGGTIVINGSFYAMTTAHSFSQASSISSAQTPGSRLPVLGIIDSYKFQGPSADNSPLPKDTPSQIPQEVEWRGNDWALIRTKPEFSVQNTYTSPGDVRVTKIDGYLKNEELDSGTVWVCRSQNEVIPGYLNGCDASIMVGSLLFTVRSVALEKQLVDGDSGAWVVRNGKLCGYIFSRIVDSAWAYMLPIEPVFEDMAKTLGPGSSVSLDVAARGTNVSSTSPAHRQVQSLRPPFRDPQSRSSLGPSHIDSAFSINPQSLEKYNLGTLLKQLDEQHQSYLETLKLVQQSLSEKEFTSELLATNTTAVTHPNDPKGKRRRRSQEGPPIDIDSAYGSRLGSSIITGESSESDIEEEFYVQKLLPSFTFDNEDLRDHLKKYQFNNSSQQLLATVVKDGMLLDASMFPKYPADERYHNSHYSVFDVGKDGAPLSRAEVVERGTSSIDSAIWQAIQSLNIDPETRQGACGRITIVREPSPILFGALHMTLNDNFNMDEIFHRLVSNKITSANVRNRAFLHDNRDNRSVYFTFSYYTITGEDFDPMPWQRPRTTTDRPQNLPISRCNSVVALALTGEPVKKLSNNTRKARKEHTDYGLVYDPWSPWHVLNIQCYPDHHHSMDVHDSTRHYVNGPEAFLATLLSEFMDAETRFSNIYNQISRLVTPSDEIIFDRRLQDKLLFEDSDLTYSRRYIWALQTIEIMKDSIRAIIDSYKGSFTDDVWEGKHKSIWPLLDEKSARNVHWKNRGQRLKIDFERVIKSLEKLHEDFDEKIRDIATLRDHLSAGTSMLESRLVIDSLTQKHFWRRPFSRARRVLTEQKWAIEELIEERSSKRKQKEAALTTSEGRKNPKDLPQSVGKSIGERKKAFSQASTAGRQSLLKTSNALAE